MTAPEQTRPTAEHTDAVAVEFEHVVVGSGYYAMNIGTSAANESARAILTSSNPETHEALAANLPADVMLDALVRAGVLRSPETVDPIAWTIHVEVPTDATEAEVGMLQDRVADAAYGMERGKWDPLVSAHTLDCVASDHCAAPRPDGPPYPKPEVAP